MNNNDIFGSHQISPSNQHNPEGDQTYACDECGDLFKLSELEECPDCDLILCKNCMEKHSAYTGHNKGNHEPTHKCDSCGNSFVSSELEKCSECGLILCSECMVKHEKFTGHNKSKKYDIYKQNATPFNYGKKKQHTAAIITLVIIFACIAVCLAVMAPFIFGSSNPQQPEAVTPTGYAPDVHATVLNTTTDFDLSKGVYYKSTIQVYNRGNGTANNVYLYTELVRDSNNYVDDSEKIYIGSLAAGESITRTVTLDGYIIYNYTVNAGVTYS